MKVELKEIGEFPIEVSIFEEEKEIGFDIEGVKFVEGINVHLSIQQTETEYYLNGVCTANAEFECARCLEPAKQSIAGELEMIAIRETGSAERFKDVDDVIPLDDKEILEFSEQIRQSFIGAMPLKVLCKPDCLGLCATCGKNRNTNPCNCSEEKTDSRWDSLKDLAD